MKTHKWLFTPWTSWSIEKYEKALEKQALSGWVLENTALSFLFSKFAKAKPIHIRYCIDYQRKVNVDYPSIMSDDGWTLVDSSGGWYLWQKEYDKERPSLFTDKQSLLDRNQRLLSVHGLVFATQIPVWIIFIRKISENPSPSWAILSSVYFFVLLLLGISAVSLLFSIAAYKKSLLKK